MHLEPLINSPSGSQEGEGGKKNRGPIERTRLDANVFRNQGPPFPHIPRSLQADEPEQHDSGDDEAREERQPRDV